MWRVQRMRLDEARAQFFMHDSHQIQVCNKLRRKKSLLFKVRKVILTNALMASFQTMLEKYPLGQARPPSEVLPSVPSAQQTATQPTLV